MTGPGDGWVVTVTPAYDAPPMPGATLDSERYRLQRGGGCLAVFGLPFLAAGLFVLCSPLLGIPWKNASGGPASWWFLIPFGSVFAAVGAGLVFGRTGIEVDRPTGTLRRWWGLLGPWVSREESLQRFDRVLLTHEVRRSDSGSYTIYPVQLAGGGAPITVASSRRYGTARQQAEGLAKFLQLTMEDRGGHEVIIRPPDRLDESVRAQARRLGAAHPRPAPPPRSALQAELSTGHARVELPAPGVQPMHWVVFAVTLVFPAFFLLGFGSAFTGWFVAFAALFIFGPPLAVGVPILAWATRRDTLTVDRHRLCVERRWAFGHRIIECDAGEIEHLAVGPPQGRGRRSSLDRGEVVGVHTDDGIVELGPGLQPLERQWLRDLLLHYLAG